MNLILVLCLAQTATPGFPIQSLRVDGNRALPAEGIIKVSGLTIGQLAEEKAFEAARERLSATGLFEQVGYRYAPSTDKKGYDATLQVVEIGQLYPFKFEDLSVGDAPVIAYLKKIDPLFAQKIPATNPFLERYAAEITKLAGEPVTGRLAAEGPDNLVVVFRPARARPAVAQTTFRGNQVIPFQPLQLAMNAVAIGEIYTEERIRQLLDTTIRPIYEERGRLQVSFPKITTEPAAENKGLNLTIDVSEGPSFDFGDIVIRGAADSKPLYDALKLKTNDMANFKEVEAGINRIKAEMRRHGYLKAEATHTRRLRPASGADARNLVDLDIRVEPGARYVFGDLTIQGLDIISEPAVRKAWSMEPGQPFNAEYPGLFLEQSKEWFDDLGETRSVVTPNDRTLQVAVTLIFKGAPRVDPAKQRNRKRPY